MKLCEFIHFIVSKRQKPSRDINTLSDNSNNKCVCEELFRYAILRKHFLKVIISVNAVIKCCVLLSFQ